MEKEKRQYIFARCCLLRVSFPALHVLGVSMALANPQEALGRYFSSFSVRVIAVELPYTIPSSKSEGFEAVNGGQTSWTPSDLKISI